MIRKIAIGIVIVLLVAVGAAYLMPSTAHVERSTTIDAPPERVFAIVNDFNTFNSWSPWFERDPDGEYNVEGPPGKGQKLTWKSEKDDVGSGSQIITSSTPHSEVLTDLDFGEMGTAHAFFKLEAVEGGTKVTWGFDSELGMNPIARYMGLMMDGWVGADYEKGLANLKALAEKES